MSETKRQSHNHFLLLPPVVAGVTPEAHADLGAVQLLWTAVSIADDGHSGYVVDGPQVHLPPGVVLFRD